MARRPAFKVSKTPDGWCVNVPASLAESGNRERHFHKTRDAANAHASRLREQFQKHGVAAAVIRPSLAEAAVLAEKILRPWGVSLAEAGGVESGEEGLEVCVLLGMHGSLAGLVRVSG